ncbi:hypothetical protein [Salidesulfovibrio onnuriiensis]|uniref:hypothetical protein n=1 Tax=Salidesulfovibrio onnuriiensis TaxID=2583823 RepID=UPI0011CB630A|nr:hypothetical protein [Salidesulfovibrio onnuriiensis]
MKLELDTKEKGFSGIMLVGGLAGLLEGTLAHGFALHYIFPGAVLTITTTFLGGLMGFILKDLLRLRRGLKPYSPIHNDGMVLGAFMGSLLGTLVQIASSATGANILVGSLVGSWLGGIAGALTDEYVSPILALLRHKEPTWEKNIFARLFPQ